MLSSAYAEGRLTREEHDERVDQLMMAKTFDDLISITRDLVVVGTPTLARQPTSRFAIDTTANPLVWSRTSTDSAGGPDEVTQFLRLEAIAPMYRRASASRACG